MVRVYTLFVCSRRRMSEAFALWCYFEFRLVRVWRRVCAINGVVFGYRFESFDISKYRTSDVSYNIGRVSPGIPCGPRVVHAGTWANASLVGCIKYRSGAYRFGYLLCQYRFIGLYYDIDTYSTLLIACVSVCFVFFVGVRTERSTSIIYTQNRT